MRIIEEEKYALIWAYNSLYEEYTKAKRSRTVYSNEVQKECGLDIYKRKLLLMQNIMNKKLKMKCKFNSL